MNIIEAQMGGKQKGMEAMGDPEEARRKTAQRITWLEVEGENEQCVNKE